MLSPPDRTADHFAVLGVPRGFDLDLAEAERRYKELARSHHPDRFARAHAGERRAALEWTVRLNDAWRVLKDPVRRAEYLLALAGVEVGGEEGTKKDGVRQPVPQDLLMDVMERRMELGEAREAGDETLVARLAADMRARVAACLLAVGEGFAATPPDLERVTRELVALRYWRRFLDEVAAHEDAKLGARVHG